MCLDGGAIIFSDGEVFQTPYLIYTTGSTVSIPSPFVVIRSVCLCNYVFVLVVFALCHLLHSIHIQVLMKMQRTAVGGLLSCSPAGMATEKWLLHSLTMVSCCVSLVFGMLRLRNS